MAGIRVVAQLAATLALLAWAAAGPAEAPLESISNRDAARWYREDSPVLFVDLRTERERRQHGRLARALWFPTRGADAGAGQNVAVLADRVLRAVDGDPHRTIVMVCAKGVAAADGAAALRARGFRRVLVVEGGLWAGEPWLAFELEDPGAL